MSKVTYIEPDGTTRTIEAANGLSVMEAALGHGVPGIDGDCGGACACATCHVYVEEAWLEKLPAQSELERGMLDFAVEVKDNSRLSCQIKMSPVLDGLVVHTPARQY
jgi:ferredoxin, 2Fe-2S